jgi:hypothetical protein
VDWQDGRTGISNARQIARQIARHFGTRKPVERIANPFATIHVSQNARTLTFWLIWGRFLGRLMHVADSTANVLCVSSLGVLGVSVV